MSTVELLQYLTEIGSNYSSRFIPYENIGSLENKQIVEQVFGFILAIQICNTKRSVYSTLLCLRSTLRLYKYVSHFICWK